MSAACEIAVVVPLVKGKPRDIEYDDVDLRLWCCFRRLDIPSDDGYSSGVGVSPLRRTAGSSPGNLPAVAGEPVIAVVGVALPVTDPPGFRPMDMREVIETFEDREPGRMGDCGCGLLRRGIVIGGGEGDTVTMTPGSGSSCSSCCSAISTSGPLSSVTISGGGCDSFDISVMIGSGVA